MRQCLAAIHVCICGICFSLAADSAWCAEEAAEAPPKDVASLPARPAPEWVTRGVMYQIQPRAFTPEGTLGAATARLADVAGLGVNILYLCPVFVADDDPDVEQWSPRQRASKMNNPRNPYRIKDYFHVDSEYGSDEDLKRFVAEAHRLDMRVLLDMVYLHCGPNAVFVQDHPDFVRRDANGNIVTQAWGFPAINFDNPALREYLWQNMEYWLIEFGVDGFRCDVAGRIPLDFWEVARERLEKIRPDVCMLAESSAERPAEQLKAFDLNYSFAWFDAMRRVYEKKEPASCVRETTERLAKTFPRGARFIHYVDNHDIANDCWDRRIEKVWGGSGVDAALVAIFTLDGVPMLYNGQEVADTARHSIFGRLPIDWSNGETAAGQARRAFCSSLSELRRAQRALTEGTVVWLENDRPDAVLSFMREMPDETIVVMLNLSNGPVEAQVVLPEKAQPHDEVLLNNGVVIAQDGGRLTCVCQPFGYLVAKGTSQ